MNKYVYVVSAGEACEGHNPMAVKDTLKKAKRYYSPRLKFVRISNSTWKANISNVDEVYIERFLIQ